MLPAGAVRRLHVHLFVAILAHIGDVEIAGEPVEGEPPGIAQAIGPEFWPSAGLGRGRDSGREWHSLSCPAHIDAQHLAQQHAPDSRHCPRDRWRCPHPRTDVQITIRPELQLAAIVIDSGWSMCRIISPEAGSARLGSAETR